MNDGVKTEKNGVKGIWNPETNTFTLHHEGKKYFAGSKDGPILVEEIEKFLWQQIEKFLEDPKSFKEDHR
jgi:hypothetical protein